MATPFRREFTLIILSEEPLVESDIDLVKEALALAAAPFTGENDGMSRQRWILENGEERTDFDEFH